MIKFRYKYIKIGLYYRPIISVVIRHNNISSNYMALLDSGADFNIFHSDLAHIFGIDLSKLKTITFGGINKGSKGVGYLSAITIGVENYLFDTSVIFCDSISPNGYGIVGQNGFFNKFKIRFDYKGKDIYLKTNT